MVEAPLICLDTGLEVAYKGLCICEQGGLEGQFTSTMVLVWQHVFAASR
jgi:hypothetical protein